jgi:hypothetical protein
VMRILREVLRTCPPQRNHDHTSTYNDGR